MSQSTIPKLVTVAQFAEQHPAFTEGSLRWLRFNQAENGFERAFLSCGRKLLIDVDSFFEVLRKQNDRDSEASRPDA